MISLTKQANGIVIKPGGEPIFGEAIRADKFDIIWQVSIDKA